MSEMQQGAQPLFDPDRKALHGVHAKTARQAEFRGATKISRRFSSPTPMGLRHAAALALVSRYLMAPPPLRRQQWKVSVLRPPLSSWLILDSFDSAAQCKAKSAEIKTKADARIAKYESTKFAWDPMLAVLEGELEAECIATDDPRLKEGIP